MSKVRVEYLGVEASGRTVGEARKAAAAEATFVCSHRPKIFAYRGHAVMIWYVPNGTCYAITHPDTEGANYSCSFTGRESVVYTALHHLLQITRLEGEYDVPRWVLSEIGREDAARLVSDWRSSDGFQRAYRAAAERGLPEQERHQWACENARNFLITAVA